MSLSDVGVSGQRVDVLSGGDVDPSGRLLSVAEIQQAFRELRARSTAANADAKSSPASRAVPAAAPPPMTTAAPRQDDARPAEATRAVSPTTPRAETTLTSPATPTAPDGDRLADDWIAVAAAHAGAGASAVSLALADALAAAGEPVRLIESAHPTRSGLVAAASAELGLDVSGAWRRGSRGTATIYRRAHEENPDGWPELEPHITSTVVDLGLPAPAGVARLAADRPRLVVVFRPSIPGVRAAEQLLDALRDDPIALAAVGSKRWPGEVVHSVGPRLRALRAAHRVVHVEEDRGLQVTGLTHAPLPRPVVAAGAALLGLIDPAQQGAVSQSAHGAPWSRKKGTS